MNQAKTPIETRRFPTNVPGKLGEDQDGTVSQRG